MNVGTRSGRPSPLRWAAVAWLAGTVVLGSGAIAARAAEPRPVADQPVEPRPETDRGTRLFQRDCAVCHGPEAEGTTQGPDLDDRGPAGLDFVLRTGRMPIEDPDQPLRHRDPLYTEDEIAAIVAYASSFVDGPAIPDVDTDEDLLARGGQAFRTNCAACHQMVGTGGALIDARHAPTLQDSTATEIVEAIRFGPGTMPRFAEETIPVEDANAIATYITGEIQHPTDPGGLGLGHFGPWSEGFVIWTFGLGSLLVATGWIGHRT